MRLLLLLAGGLLTFAGTAGAQQPIRITAGWSVDTTGMATPWTEVSRIDDVRVIFRRWAEYLRSDPRRQAATPLWSAQEQRRWPNYDLTAFIAYQGMPATVVEIAPATVDSAAAWVVRTLFASEAGDNAGTRPVALTRVYAIRENGEWVFSSALTHLTREWARQTVGAITYVIEPGYPFDRTRARRAVAFADSLAHAFEVPRPDSLTYYLTGSPEAMRRIMGLDWAGTGGGFASYANRMIFSGDPALGEEYRHELAHFVLGPLLAAGRAHAIISEGVATWLGGAMGRDLASLLAEYAAYIRARPTVTLDAALAEDGADLGSRPAGALLVRMAFERGGTQAVKDLLGSGRSTAELRAALERVLGATWQDIADRWRVLAERGPV